MHCVSDICNPINLNLLEKQGSPENPITVPVHQ